MQAARCARRTTGCSSRSSAAVGASGYVVNLAVYALLLNWAGLHYLGAAFCSFLVAVANNYWWNRHWTFRGQRGHFAYQGMRFAVVSAVALGGEPPRPARARRARGRQGRRAGDRDRRRDAAEFRRQQALVVQRSNLTRCAGRSSSYSLPSPRSSSWLQARPRATTPTRPVFDAKGHMIQTPLAPPRSRACAPDGEARDRDLPRLPEGHATG